MNSYTNTDNMNKDTQMEKKKFISKPSIYIFYE